MTLFRAWSKWPRLRAWLGGAALLMGVACVRTNLDSIPTPQGNSAPLARVMVIVNVRDIGIRRTGEDAAAADSRPGGTEFVQSYRYMPPVQEWDQWTPAQKDSLYSADSIDAVMVIGAANAGVAQTPYSSSSASCTSRDPNTGACNTASGVTTGGTISKPWMSTQITVIAVPSRKQIWTATSNSGGGATVGFGRLMESVATHAVDKLRQDGLAN